MFFFKQKTAYEMRISDWSSDVCSSDLPQRQRQQIAAPTADERPRNRLRGHHRRPREPFYHHLAAVRQDRKGVVEGKSVSVRVDIGGSRIIKKKTRKSQTLRYKAEPIH